jgi:hypothetical protein
MAHAMPPWIHQSNILLLHFWFLLLVKMMSNVLWIAPVMMRTQCAVIVSPHPLIFSEPRIFSLELFIHLGQFIDILYFFSPPAAHPLLYSSPQRLFAVAGASAH